LAILALYVGAKCFVPAIRKKQKEEKKANEALSHME
jgi:hypothetical protein